MSSARMPGVDHLPIDARLPDIDQALQKHQIVVVDAPTGTGKTLRIAPDRARRTSKPVFLLQTRRNAVRWNANRICYESGTQPGEFAGWFLRGETNNISKNTRVQVLIVQSFINRVRREGKLPEGTIIVDEAHEAKMEQYQLLGLIKEMLPKSPNTRVIITSATLHVEKYQTFFGLPKDATVKVKRKLHYVAKSVARLKRGEHHSEAAIRVARELFDAFIDGRLAVPTRDGKGQTNVGKGAIGILLPGKADIEQGIRELKQYAKQRGVENLLETMDCYSGSENQDQVQSPVPEGKLRLIFSTEILRSSVTVPDLIGIVDSLQVNRSIVDSKGVAHRMKIAISKAEAEQAAGRPGRLGTGFYIACSFEREYENLEPFPTPEVLCSPITSVALELAAMDRNVRTFDMPDRPKAEMVDATMSRLIRLGALNAQERITDLGRKLVRFPIDPERAAALLFASTRGVLEEAVVAMAVDENEGIFFRPRQREKAIIVNEHVLQMILSFYDFSRGLPLDRPWIDTDDLEITALDLPGWIVPKGEKFEILCGNHNFPHKEGQRWIADCIRRYYAGMAGSDFSAGVRAYRAFKEEQRKAYASLDSAKREDRKKLRRGIEGRLRAWCSSHCLNYKKVLAVGNTIKLLIEELAEAGMRLSCSPNDERDFSDRELTKSLIAAFIDGVAVAQTLGNKRDYLSATASFSLAWGSACTTSRLILVANVSKIPLGGTNHMFIADCAAPIEESWLRELLPQMFSSGTELSLEPFGGQAVAHDTTRFANICLTRIKREISTAQAARAVAEAVEDGRVSAMIYQELQSVCARNASLVKRKGKKKWPYRAREERIRFFQQRLQGVSGLKDIQNPQQLLLPGA